MKVGTQIEVNCRRTISYICKGILAQSFSWKKLGNQKPTGNTVCNARRTSWMRARWTNIYLSKLLCICPSLFEKKISTKQDIASTEISYQFLAPKVPLLIWGEIKPPTAVLQPIHFQLQQKPLYYASVNSSCAKPPLPPGLLTAGHFLALSVRGGGICKFWAARGPGICQPQGEPWISGTHAVSYQNITTQRILLEKQADWLIYQGRGKIEEVCKGMFSISCMHFFIAYQARIT